MDPSDVPSRFYRGLVAELYEPLLSSPARADDYAPFLARSGTPALELACGSGLPLVELVERGFEVDGLDSSQDMLDRCRARAAARGLDVALHLAEMQSFSLPRTYRSIFLAGASFTLLPTDDDALRALAQIHAHLEPGGSALIPLEIEDLDTARTALQRTREVAGPNGERLRLTVVALDASERERTVCRRLRYERIHASGRREGVERDWRRRWWPQAQFREMLAAAGFEKLALLSPEGGRARPDASVFVALAQRSSP